MIIRFSFIIDVNAYVKMKGNDFMEMDMTKKCPVVEVNGFIEKGKQFDLDIELPEGY